MRSAAGGGPPVHDACHRSQTLDGLAANHQLVLLEALLEGASILPPPLPIEGVGHDLVDDDVIAPCRSARVVPETLRRRSAIGCESAKALGLDGADGRVLRGREGAAACVAERQEQLDEVNGAASQADSYGRGVARARLGWSKRS